MPKLTDSDLRKLSSKEEWLGYLEHKNHQEIQLGLARVQEASRRLKLLPSPCVTIIVGGTNGKGSTVAALEQIYFQAGYCVASYTSPHLLTFNERIKVQLQCISDEMLCELFYYVESTCEELNLTYFEVATLTALLYFKRYPIDIMILEVGLGGRLDATNVIDPDLAIITTVDYDHQEYLGHTLEAIGAEKAGIFRPHIPCLYGDTAPPDSVLKKAQSLSSLLYLYGQDFAFQEQEGGQWCFRSAKLSIQHLTRPTIQLKSAATAIFASILLHDKLPVEESSIRQAMTAVFVPGRLQWEQTSKQGVRVLYDVSHNLQAAHLLATAIRAEQSKGRVHVVFAALKDKDILGLILSVKDCVTDWYPAQLNNKRAVDSDYLLAICKKEDIFVKICYTTPFAAYEAALAKAVSGDLVVVFGSFVTVGHIMAMQQQLADDKGIL